MDYKVKMSPEYELVLLLAIFHVRLLFCTNQKIFN